MAFRVKVSRADRYLQFARELQDNMTELVDTTAAQVAEEAIESVSNEDGGGRFYKMRGSGQPGRVSISPNPPASDTGHLRNNIHVATSGDLVDRSRVTRDVESRADYSEHLEFGTRYMDERPFMQPAADNGRIFMRRNAHRIIRRRRRRGRR